MRQLVVAQKTVGEIGKHPRLREIEDSRGPRLSEETRSRLRAERARQRVEREALAIERVIGAARAQDFRLAPDALCDLADALENHTLELSGAASDALSEVARDMGLTYSGPDEPRETLPVEWWERGI